MDGVRRGACVLAVLLGCASPALPAEIVVLESSDVAAWRPALDALRKALAGDSISVLSAKEDASEAERLLRNLEPRKATLVAVGPLAVRAVRAVAPKAPLVYCMVADPEALGLLVDREAAGVAMYPPVKHQLAAFRMVNPRGVRVGVVYAPSNTESLMAEAGQVARLLGMSLVLRP